jgi:Mg/Co/Ni transporter MgtE
MELSRLSPAEISQYPITFLSSDDIELVLKYLHPVNLKKVLMYIPQGALVKIYNDLTPATFNQILNSLPVFEKIQVLNRLTPAS